MAKFGELLNLKIPVLICFYDPSIHLSKEFDIILRNLAISVGNFSRIITIDGNKNQALIKALRIKHNPTYLVYFNGELQVRLHDLQTENQLFNTLKPFMNGNI